MKSRSLIVLLVFFFSSCYEEKHVGYVPFQEVWFSSGDMNTDSTFSYTKELEGARRIAYVLSYYGCPHVVDDSLLIWIPKEIANDEGFRLSVTHKSEDSLWFSEHQLW